MGNCCSPFPSCAMILQLSGQMILQFLCSGNLTWLAGEWTQIEDVFPSENGDIPVSYLSLPKAKRLPNVSGF